MRLLRERGEKFSEVYSLMETSFPKSELRDGAAARAVLSDRRYRLYRITERGEFLGFVTVWKLSGFAFIEHFAMRPDIRGKGYGSLALAALGKKYPALVLEVEPPKTDIQKRRVAFYERCGFHLSLEDYYQPPYQKGCEPVRLMLMRYPTPIENHGEVKDLLYREVYGIIK